MLCRAMWSVGRGAGDPEEAGRQYAMLKSTLFWEKVSSMHVKNASISRSRGGSTACLLMMGCDPRPCSFIDIINECCISWIKPPRRASLALPFQPLMRRRHLMTSPIAIKFGTIPLCFQFCRTLFL